jgi:hypothetical protein
MKKYIIVSLLAATSCFAAEKKEGDGFLSGVYIEPVGIIKYANITDKPQYGAGIAAGFQLNPSVKLDVLNFGLESPDNWHGSAIDETDVTAKFDLFKAVGGKLSLYGVAGGARDWSAEDWGLDLGAGLKYKVYDSIYVSGQYVYQIWKNQKQASLLQFGIGYSF